MSAIQYLQMKDISSQVLQLPILQIVEQYRANTSCSVKVEKSRSRGEHFTVCERLIAAVALHVELQKQACGLSVVLSRVRCEGPEGNTPLLGSVKPKILPKISHTVSRYLPDVTLATESSHLNLSQTDIEKDLFFSGKISTL